MNGPGRDSSDPFRPARWVELVAHAGRWVDRSAPGLDAADLRRRAARRLGRPVVAPDPGLDVLIADSAKADLTPLGRVAVRAQLVRRIVAAEELSDTLARWPQLDRVNIPRPLVIVGLPRTGTTLLHCLLARDRAAFAPRFWQLQRPVPPRNTLASGGRFVRAALTAGAAKLMLPALRDIHPVRARQPEECVFLFRDVGTHAVPFPAFGYLRWLQDDGSGAVDYLAYRRYLQVLLGAHPDRRPVLKSPFHVGHLDDLLAVLPDALIVHTHRDPGAALASWCSFAATIGRGTVRSIDLDQLGQSWLDFWAHAAARAVSVRSAAASSRFHDVRYAELVADPLRVVAEVYAAADLELTAATRERMARWLDRRHDGRTRHRYELAQFGLDATSVGARFSAYQSL